MAKNILKDWKHWLGWTISATLITAGVILLFHLMKVHVVHTPLWRVPLVFMVVFVIVVITDTIKHYTKLQ